jgi:hypothetical protein
MTAVRASLAIVFFASLASNAAGCLRESKSDIDDETATGSAQTSNVGVQEASLSTANLFKCGVDGCPGGSHSRGYFFSPICGAGNPNQTMCEMDTSPTFWQCGIDGCAGGFHSRAYNNNSACVRPGLGTTNITMCEANASPTYWQCGIDGCAGGFHSRAYNNNSGCIRPGLGTTNITMCEANASDYWSCGTSCPAGVLIGLGFNQGCTRPGLGNPNIAHCLL